MAAPQTRTRTGLLAAAALLALVGAAAGCSEVPSVTRTAGPGSTDGVAVTTGLTRYDEAERAVAPVLEGPSVTDETTVSTSRPGRVVVVNVWQSSCGPCRAESAALEETARTTASDATFVGLDVDDQEASARAFLRASASTYPHLFDPDGQQLLKLAGVLPLQAIPSTLVVDRRGRIAARIIGPVSAESLTQLVEETASSA